MPLGHISNTVCPRADEESPPPEDAHSDSSDNAPPDEVAPDPPTLDWFWGQYNICLSKSLSPAEKARQVAFKKEMAEEEARYQWPMKPVMPPGKRRRWSFGGRRVVVRRRCTKTGTSRGRSKALGASLLHEGGPISSSMPPTRSSGRRPTKWQDCSPRRGRLVRQALRGGGGGVLPSRWEDAVHQGAAG